MPIKFRIAAAVISLVIALTCLLARWQSYLELESDPDSVEYAAGASGIASGSGYSIIINGDSFPPRYPPWFSAMLAPSVWLYSGIGGAILVMAFCAGASMYMTFRAGYMLGGPSGALLASALLASLPIFRNFSCNIMTEVPFLLMVLCLFSIHVKAVTAGGYDTKHGLYYGLFLAIAMGMKPLAILLIMPSVISAILGRKHRLQTLTALTVPPILIMAGTAVYNLLTFGSFSRNGYNYWCPIPFDFPGLVFSHGYLKYNIMTVLTSDFIVVSVILMLLVLLWAARKHCLTREHRAALMFLVSGVALYSAPYLLYFYTDDRFFISFSVTALLVSAGILPALIPDKGRRLINAAAFSMLLLAVVMLSAGGRKDYPRQNAVEKILANTPADAVVFSAINPALLSFSSGTNSARFFIPVSRNVEYASKAIARNKLSYTSQGLSLEWNHRPPEIFQQGAIDIFTSVLLEDPDLALNLMRAGRRTFISTELLHPDDAALVGSLTNRYIFLQAAPMLYELKPRQ